MRYTVTVECLCKLNLPLLQIKTVVGILPRGPEIPGAATSGFRTLNLNQNLHFVTVTNPEGANLDLA